MAFTRILGPGIHTASNINSHNIKSTGIITAVSFVGDGAGLTGIASTDNIITGTAATFNTYPVDINAGMTVAGVATFSGNVTIAGVLTYEDVKNVDSLGIITARSGVDVDDFLDVGSNIKLGNAGVITATTFKGDGDFVELDVDGHTNLDNVNVAGVTTFASTVNAGTINATLFSGASQIGIQSAGTQIGAGITQLNFVGAGNTFKVTGTTVDVSISGNTGAGGTWNNYTAGIATTKSVGINTSNFDDPDIVGAGNSFQGLYISNGMMITDNSLHGNHYIGTAFNGLMAGPVNIEGTLTIDGNYVVV